MNKTRLDSSSITRNSQKINLLIWRNWGVYPIGTIWFKTDSGQSVRIILCPINL